MTLRELLERATPGPWHVRRNDQDDGRIHYDVDDADEREVACVRHALPHTARLIVALREIAKPLVRLLDDLKPYQEPCTTGFNGPNARRGMRWVCRVCRRPTEIDAPAPLHADDCALAPLLATIERATKETP